MPISPIVYETHWPLEAARKRSRAASVFD
jgi:hypothetical protein